MEKEIWNDESYEFLVYDPVRWADECAQADARLKFKYKHTKEIKGDGEEKRPALFGKSVHTC